MIIHKNDDIGLQLDLFFEPTAHGVHGDLASVFVYM